MALDRNIKAAVWHQALLVEMCPQSSLSHASEHVTALEQTKLVPVDMVRDRTRAPVANVSTGR